MQPTATFFSGFSPNDLLFLGEAALRTLWLSILAITIGSTIGVFLGWSLNVSTKWGAYTIALVLDIF